jgi:ketosteroid isomerase-like protein
MSDQNKQTTRRVLEELFEKGNMDATDELVHPDFVNHEAPPNNQQGPEGLKETVEWLRGLWGPMRFEIEDEIAEGD